MGRDGKDESNGKNRKNGALCCLRLTSRRQDAEMNENGIGREVVDATVREMVYIAFDRKRQSHDNSVF